MGLKGIITAMVTPFNEDETIDHKATKQLVNKLISKGVHGLFILGTNGEFHMMQEEEKIEFAKLVITEADGRVPVYVGTGGNSTQDVIQLSQKMAALGADALSIISPYFVGLTSDELMMHYLEIADNVNIPIILYNIPKNTGLDMTTNLVKKLSDHPNIIGIKDSSGDIEKLEAYILETKDKEFDVLIGSDSLILKGLNLGATGAVAATSNVLTRIDIEIYENWLNKDMAAAEAMQNSIEEFRRILKFGTIPSVLKAAIGCEGISVGVPKRPVAKLTTGQYSEIKHVMSVYNDKFDTL